MPRVSVLIPVFNNADVFPNAVSDVLAQSMADVEVIVIDDASTDASAATAARLAEGDDRVRLVSAAENRGAGAARALGLGAARGEWIAILDADDRWQPDRLERLLNIAQEHALDAIADNLVLIDPGLDRSVGLAFPLSDDRLETLTPERVLANAVPGGRVNLGWMQPMVRREFLRRHGITWRPIRHAEDLVYTMEILLAGAAFQLSGWGGYRYTQRRGTTSARASKQSRTKRDTAEQQKAVATIAGLPGIASNARLRRRLSRMHHEVAVTTWVLDARDAADERRWLAAGVLALRAMSRPRALASCLVARYGPNSRRIV